MLVDRKKKHLINDFMLRTMNVDGSGLQQAEEGKAFDVIHTLNIQSPGWTSAMPFVNRVTAELLGLNE